MLEPDFIGIDSIGRKLGQASLESDLDRGLPKALHGLDSGKLRRLLEID
jgi:hypothetical protein